jgi:DNA-binding response OmpR family regulator
LQAIPGKTMKDARVLIVEDNDEVAQMLVLFFSARGLKVSVAQDGATALRLIGDAPPNVILLDVGLPDIEGYELFERFRQRVRSRHIPVIFLTRRSRKSDRLAGLQLGADDFISKPFDLEELYLRVHNAVARAVRENLCNPHTGLPGSTLTGEALAAADGRLDRAILRFHLRHAAEFRDQYGALAGADLLRYTALLINRVLNTLGAPDDFLGQSGDESFVVITTPERAGPIRHSIVERFDRDALQHYALAERSGDRVRVRDAAGQERELPLLGLEAIAA